MGWLVFDPFPLPLTEAALHVIIHFIGVKGPNEAAWMLSRPAKKRGILLELAT